MDIEIHICTILMGTVRYIDGFCSEECENRSDCPVMGVIKGEENE